MTKKRVLFLCTGNSARSQMAEGLVNNLLSDAWEAHSAGTNPAGYVHPLAIRAMAELGMDISAHRSKSVREFNMADFDLIITLCDDAARNCPACNVSLRASLASPGRTRAVHIGFPDPATAMGTEDERLAAFRQIRDGIQERVLSFLEKENE